MRTDILEYFEFYQSPLGVAAYEAVSGRLTEAWGDVTGLTIAGFGYANPYLELFKGSAGRISLAPGGQGVISWPRNGANAACLAGEQSWPLPDASLDRLLIVHGLEEAPAPHRLMREAWRVLKDDGRVIIVAAHRRGLWSVIDSTPFAAGRPYLKGRLERLLTDAMFRPRKWDTALLFPPFHSKLLLRAAGAWERAGARLWPGLGGVLMLEAEKDMLAPVGLVRSAGVKVRRPSMAAPQPTRRNHARNIAPRD
ncbi:class I SAM-dependent methyltransferase [Hyphococcus sp.]|uniref:class I SAM-dependent methyltransferase n=1 Tax=Hyphococcus sp. TaxID=2038636 RepID=UPI003CCC28ED